MKTAKELIIPFSFSNRRPIFLDSNFLYVPARYKHQEMRLEIEKAAIEFCSGTGRWIVERAQNYSEIHWIAVEKKFERAKKIWQKANSLKLQNLTIACSDASDFINFYSPKAEQIFVNFPDPWPKRRHEKHRLIQEKFLKDLLDIIPENGKATCVTDDSLYAKQMQSEFDKVKEWEQHFYTHDLPEYGSSYFQDLWTSKGKKIHYQSYKRGPCSFPQDPKTT